MHLSAEEFDLDIELKLQRGPEEGRRMVVLTIIMTRIIVKQMGDYSVGVIFYM